MSEQLQHEQLTETEIAESIASEVCAACGSLKRAGAVFCVRAWSALPIGPRLQFGRGLDAPGFAAMFRGWLDHFRKHGEGDRALPSRSGAFPYRTTEEAEKAGYVWSGRAQCASPRCLASILWMRRPDKSRVALDEYPSLEFHSRSCKDPDYFQRRRERLKTSARRRRAS